MRNKSVRLTSGDLVNQKLGCSIGFADMNISHERVFTFYVVAIGNCRTWKRLFGDSGDVLRPDANMARIPVATKGRQVSEKDYEKHTNDKHKTKPNMIKQRPVIICTEHRGVFFGYAADTSGNTVKLDRARMAIYWGTTHGVMELAETGPTSSSKISARADIEVRKVTAVFEVTEAAAKRWEDAK